MTDVKELWPTIKTTEQKQKDHIAELEAGHKWNVHELDKRLTIIKQRDETIAKLEAENARLRRENTPTLPRRSNVKTTYVPWPGRDPDRFE
jgi:hypothetical protein